MNKLGIFMNFWEKNWYADHIKYINKVADIEYQGRIISEPFVQMGGEVGRDIKVWRDLMDEPSEEKLDEEARYLLNFTKAMLA